MSERSAEEIRSASLPHSRPAKVLAALRERFKGTAGRHAFLAALLLFALLFPLIDGNEGDIDAAANALAFAILALGLNKIGRAHV